MIWRWITQFLRGIIWLLRPPAARDFVQIDNCQKCPVCGARGEHPIRAMETKKGNGTTIITTPLCQHTCAVCGARWFQLPIVKDFPANTVARAIARNEREKDEDSDILHELLEKQKQSEE